MSAVPASLAAGVDERAQIRWVLEHCKTIAVVGLSSHVYKDSHIVAYHLQRNGYAVMVTFSVCVSAARSNVS